MDESSEVRSSVPPVSVAATDEEGQPVQPAKDATSIDRSQTPTKSTTSTISTSTPTHVNLGDSTSDERLHRLERPKLSSRQTSETIIIPRDSATVEMQDEKYPANDARAMSPRRASEEIEKMGDEARAALEAQAKELQASLLEIVDKVEEVKSEHEKLEGGNKFLQSYIGELMQTSKITSSGTGKQKGKSSRSSK